MKRILFVDDDTMVLDGLRAALRKQRGVWEVAFAAGGEAALAALRAAPFDAVVSDMRMPGMDGAALLARVKEEFPGMVRIVLSGHAERESVMRALPVSHQFLAKPCDAATLRAVIERACGLRDLLENDTLRRVVGETDRLPPLPRIYRELSRAVEDPDASAKEVARIVEQDTAMSAKLLQLVNSSYFGLARRVTSVENAIAYLGLELVRSLALTAHLFASQALPAVPGLSHTQLQHHSLLVAATARALAGSNAKLADDAFAAGLLHDVGLVVLAAKEPEGLGRALELAASPGGSLFAAERGTFGVTHPEIGAYLLGLWGLPSTIVEAVAFHHNPRLLPLRGVDAPVLVHVADALVEPGAPALVRGSSGEGVDEEYLAAAGMAADLPRWREVAAREMARRPPDGGARA